MDGRILGGRYSAKSGVTTLLRMNAEGLVDPDFNAYFGGQISSAWMPPTTGIIPVSGGRVLRGGGDDSIGGPAFTRHEANGARDATFQVATPTDLAVNSFDLLDDGQLLAATTQGVLLFVTGTGTPPAITSAPATTIRAGSAVGFTITATGVPAPRFVVSSGQLPAWATFDGTTGVLSGTPPDAIGSPFVFTLSAVNGVAPAAAQSFTLTVQPSHSADVSPSDGYINLVELTRVLELYNTRNGTVRTGRYGVGTGTVDGFAPDHANTGSTVFLPRTHTADTNRDGRLTLTEITRVIELFGTRSGTTRTGAYHVLAGSEDGFASGP